MERIRSTLCSGHGFCLYSLRSSGWRNLSCLAGNPITAHLGVPDPAAVGGTESERKGAFRDTYHQLDARIRLFIALPIDKLDRMVLKRRADEIGKMSGGA